MGLDDYLLMIPTLEVFQSEDNWLLCRLFDHMKSDIRPERAEKEIFREGAKDIWAVLKFRDRVDSAKNYLQAHSLDFEEEFIKRRKKIWETTDLLFRFTDTNYETWLQELNMGLEWLESEKDSLLFREMTDETYPRLKEIEEAISSTKEQIQNVSKHLDYQAELNALDEAEQNFEKIVEGVRQISSMVNNYLAESKHASLIKEFNNDLLFADIIDVTYGLFKELFDPEMTKVQLLLALNLRGQGRIPIMSQSKTAISVMIYTIISGYDPYSDTWKGDREEWARMVAGLFGIAEASYEAHRYAKNNVLHKMWKERVGLFEEYLASLDKFKQDNREILAVKQSSDTN